MLQDYELLCIREDSFVDKRGFSLDDFIIAVNANLSASNVGAPLVLIDLVCNFTEKENKIKNILNKLLASSGMAFHDGKFCSRAHRSPGSLPIASFRYDR